MKLLAAIIITILFTVSFSLQSYEDFINDCLTAHNRRRNPLGIPNLTWSNSLAAKAQNWAVHQAANRRFKHSKDRGDIGENIATGTAAVYDPVALIEQWVAEKEYFIPGRDFPYCSTTGDYHDVGHYTQLIWRKTTQVGCGTAISLGQRYMVCQYSPAGNVIGYPVY